MIIIKKNVSITDLLDAGHLNWNTDQSSESWPLELLATKLARAKKHKFSLYLLYAHAHATLKDETLKLPGFSSDDKLLLSLKDILGVEVFQKFPHKNCLTFSKDLILQGKELVHIYDMLLKLNSEPPVPLLIKQLHDNAKRQNLKLASEKNSYFCQYKIPWSWI